MGTLKLATDSRGNYRRDLGWKADGTGKPVQHRFYLGPDRAVAARRSAALGRLWEAVVARCGRLRPGERPLWDGHTLLIGMALARGEEAAEIGPDLDPLASEAGDDAGRLLRWFDDLVADFGGFGV